jgi:hypothetical protein
LTNYRIYHGVSRDHFFGYRFGDPLWFDRTEYEVDGDTDGTFPPVLDAIFARHNRDDRPDGAFAPSLSVGDIIAIDWGTEATRHYAVASFGFDEVPGPMYTDVVNETHPDGLGPDATYFDSLRSAA